MADRYVTNTAVTVLDLILCPCPRAGSDIVYMSRLIDLIIEFHILMTLLRPRFASAFSGGCVSRSRDGRKKGCTLIAKSMAAVPIKDRVI